MTDQYETEGPGKLLLAGALFLGALGIAFCAIWYFRQPHERQADIMEKAEDYLDASAAKVGGVISNVATKVKKPGEDDFPQTVSEITERFFRRPEGKILGGMPRPTDKYPFKIKVLQNKGYVVGYCEERKGAAWVAYKATCDKRLDYVQPEFNFIVDERTEARVAPGDYDFSGYERAFLASPYIVGIGRGDEACKKAFLMSNVAPQKHGLHVKWKQLERKIARTYARKFGDIWIFAGPVYHGTAGTMRSGIEIPDEYFLIVVRSYGEGFDALAFVVDQDSSQREWLRQYLTSVDRIEELTHFEFFQKLPRKIEQRLESQAAKKMW